MLLIALSKRTDKNIQAENEVLTKLILDEFNKLDEVEVDEMIDIYFSKSPLVTLTEEEYQAKSNLDKLKTYLYNYIFNTKSYYKNDFKFWSSLNSTQRREYYGFSSELSTADPSNYTFSLFCKEFNRKKNNMIGSVGEIFIKENRIPEFIKLAYVRYFELNQNDLFKFKELNSIDFILCELDTITVLKYITSKPYELVYYKWLVKEFKDFVKGWNSRRTFNIVKRPYETILSKNNVITLDVCDRSYKIKDKSGN